MFVHKRDLTTIIWNCGYGTILMILKHKHMVLKGPRYVISPPLGRMHYVFGLFIHPLVCPSDQSWLRRPTDGPTVSLSVRKVSGNYLENAAPFSEHRFRPYFRSFSNLAEFLLIEAYQIWDIGSLFWKHLEGIDSNVAFEYTLSEPTIFCTCSVGFLNYSAI